MTIKMTIKTTPDPSTTHRSDDELLRAIATVPLPRATAARTERHRQAIFDAIAADHVARRRTLSPLAAGVVAVVVAGAALAGTAMVVARAELSVVGAVGDERRDGAASRGLLPGVNQRAEPTIDRRTEANIERRSDVAVDQPVDRTVDHPVDHPDQRRVDQHVQRHQHHGGAPRAADAPPAAGLAWHTPDPVPLENVAAALTTDLTRDVDDLVAGREVRSTTARLGTASQRDNAAVDAALADAVGDVDDDQPALARLRRVRCELQLRFGRQALALEVCATFIRHHPDDDGARPLAFGAGGLAEELGLLDQALSRYADAIVLSPLAGQSSADALKARARVHARMGHDDDARADLRVFLGLHPAGAFDDDVTGLAARLGLTLPR